MGYSLQGRKESDKTERLHYAAYAKLPGVKMTITSVMG